MARFEVYSGIAGGPLLLDCQGDSFRHFATRFVIPLLPAGSVPDPIQRMHLIFKIEGVDRVMATHLAAAIPVRSLGRSIMSLRDHDYRIIAALDVLLSGV